MKRCIPIHSLLSSPAKAGDPVFQSRLRSIEKPRRTGSLGFAGMTVERWDRSVATISPPKPFRLARQFHGLDLLELDGALLDQVVEIAVGRTRDFRAVEVDLERAAMVLLGPG